MKVDFNIIKDTSNKTKVIIFGIITVLVSLIGLTYAWVANWLVGTSNDMSLTAASLYLNYRGTSPTILAYLAPGETVEKNFEIVNYNSTTTTYNLTWQAVQNLFNPTSEIIYTVSEKTLGEIVSARTAPSSDVNVARNISIAPGETQYLTLTLTFVLDEERDQTNNIGNYFVGDITIDQNIQGNLNYTEIYANDVLVRSIPDIATFKFDDKRSWCTDGTTISFNTENSAFSYANLTSATSCKAYFYTSKDFAYVAPTPSVSSPYYTYVVPYDGWYEIEAWGAEGGRNAVEAGYTYSQSVLGGKGGYTNGKIYLNASDTLYVYIGGKGSDGISGQIVSGGYNGGGQGDYDHSDNEAAAAGGGATDIRLSTSINSINSRIMVAAGGGGAAYNGMGGYGGGLIGGETTYSTGGTQVDGYSFATAMPGTFVNTNVDVGGGGGGYYGGYANSSGTTSIYKTSGAGGSSYISGHTGCVAIASESLTNNPRTPRAGTGGVSCETGTTENSCSIHYSNKYFKDTKMIDGSGHLWTYQQGIEEKIPNPNGGYYDLGFGHTGDGYARIKYIPNLATHTMTFDLAGGVQSKDYDGEYYEGYNYYIENPTRYAYHFIGWIVNGIGTKVNNNILTVGVTNANLTASWDPAYTLTIDLAGGTGGIEVTDYIGSGENLYIPIPTKPGYNFLGWTISATDGSASSTGSTINGTTFIMGTKNTTLTANWAMETYNIIYDLKGAAQVNNPVTYNIVTSTFTLINPTATNCTFLGWTGSNGTIPSTSVTITTGTVGNKSYTTNWSCSKNFEYINGQETFTVPLTGTYILEVWGAAGNVSRTTQDESGACTQQPSYGGYSVGYITLSNSSTPYLYVNVGGHPGGSKNGGYNGGGSTASSGGQGGGGATHIATTSGVLSSLSSLENQAKVLIVAGGGGGSDGGGHWCGSGGNGGGIEGNYGLYGSSLWTGPGNQTESLAGPHGAEFGSFGQGASSPSQGSGGGGGWWGGSSAPNWSGSGGGSGYIGNPDLINKYMYCKTCTTSSDASTLTYTTECKNLTPTANCAKVGHGYARITYIP